jgi:hypothetical protein
MPGFRGRSMPNYRNIAGAISGLILFAAVPAWAQGANAASSPSPTANKAFQSSGIKVSIVSINPDMSNKTNPRFSIQLAIQNTRDEGVYLSILRYVTASDNTGTNYQLYNVSGFSSCGPSSDSQQNIAPCERDQLGSFDGYTFIDPVQMGVANLNYGPRGNASMRVPDTFSFSLSLLLKSLRSARHRSDRCAGSQKGQG